MKITSSLFFSLALTASSSAMVVSTFSVDFHGTSQPDTLAPGNSAGVISTTNWIAALGLTGGTSGVTNTGIGGTISVGWNAPASGVISGSSSANADEDMMEGYLIATAAEQVDVQIGTMNLAALGWDFYDVYVYSDQGVSPAPISLLTLAPSVGLSTTYTHVEPGVGYGAGVTSYVDSQTFPMGNYVKYSGLTASTITVLATPSSNQERAAINGIEIVGYRAVPEPSTSLAVLVALGGFAFCRRRV